MNWGQGHSVSMCKVPALKSPELTSQRARTQKDAFVRKQRVKTKAQGLPRVTLTLSRDANTVSSAQPSGVPSAWAVNPTPASRLSAGGMTERGMGSLLHIGQANSVYCT